MGETQEWLDSNGDEPDDIEGMVADAAEAKELTHPHPIDGTHQGLARDCAACQEEEW